MANSTASAPLVPTHLFLLSAISRLLCFPYLLFQGGIQQHSLRQPTASRITVTEAGSVSSYEGLNTNIIVHGKNDNANDDVL